MTLFDAASAHIRIAAGQINRSEGSAEPFSLAAFVSRPPHPASGLHLLMVRPRVPRVCIAL